MVNHHFAPPLRDYMFGTFFFKRLIQDSSSGAGGTCSSKWTTLPETNSSPLKMEWMVGIGSFPIGSNGLFSGANSLLVSGRVCF